jgi:hypothetical protein
VDVGNKSFVTNDNEEVILEEGTIRGEAISKQVVIVHQGQPLAKKRLEF